MGLLSRVSMKVSQKLLNCLKSTREVGDPINIGELLKEAPKIKVGIFESSKKSYEPLTNMLLKSLKERFRIAIEFLKHGHNPSAMVSKNEVEVLLSQKLKEAPRIKLPLYKGRKTDEISKDVNFIQSQINSDIEAGKEMLKILV